MFSIIIPVYNKAEYISKCINSVLTQTYSDFELILVNDGSTDDSLSIIKLINDSRIIIIDQYNTGVSVARNIGVKKAIYDYIAFLDADDWWQPTFLEEFKRLIESYPLGDLYACNYYYVKHGICKIENKGISNNFTAGYINFIAIYASKFCVLINCSFVVITKSAFLYANGFRTELKFGEDFDLWLRISLEKKIVYLNKALAFSNQDVDASQRAIGNERVFPPESHFIFNMTELKPLEKNNGDLKKLLDGLKVRLLIPYYLTRKYTFQVNMLLSEVDFTIQPLYYRLIYSAPFKVVYLYFKLMKLASIIKKHILCLKIITSHENIY